MKFFIALLSLILTLEAHASGAAKSDLFYSDGAVKLSLSKLQTALTTHYKYPVSQVRVSLEFDSIFSHSEDCNDRHYREVEFKIVKNGRAHLINCQMTIAKACWGHTTDGDVSIYSCQSDDSDVLGTQVPFEQLLSPEIVKF